MANQASYLKELIGQHNSSLLEDLEITEYVDTSLNAVCIVFWFYRIENMYIMLFGSIILQSVLHSF